MVLYYIKPYLCSGESTLLGGGSKSIAQIYWLLPAVIMADLPSGEEGRLDGGSAQILGFNAKDNWEIMTFSHSYQVVLKIIKHCEEEGGSAGELVQGVLLGLVQDDTLEITNCFPFPKHADEENFDDGK